MSKKKEGPIRSVLTPLMTQHSVRELADETGVNRFSLQRFIEGGGLNTASTEALMDYFDLRLTPRRKPGRKASG